MIPLEEYATVSRDATLLDAVIALREGQRNSKELLHAHKSVLVLDQDGEVVGKLSPQDLLQSLEPRYSRVEGLDSVSRYGFTPEFIAQIMDQYELLQKPLDDICERSSKIQVSEAMYAPKENEYVDAGASLNKAIHQLVVLRHQTLLVREGGKVVGILRNCDVFEEVCNRIQVCGA
jgi:predicted transcriptional regulator